VSTQVLLDLSLPLLPILSSSPSFLPWYVSNFLGTCRDKTAIQSFLLCQELATIGTQQPLVCVNDIDTRPDSRHYDHPGLPLHLGTAAVACGAIVSLRLLSRYVIAEAALADRIREIFGGYGTVI
jgi:hypothetical protein